MTGCCYGRACDLPWAIRFPEGHETHPLDKPATPVHPTQIYESLLNLALYGALAWLFRRKKFDGQVFAIYLVSYAVLRSFVELFRGDYLVRYLGGIATPAQLVSIGIFLVGLFLLWQLPRPEQKAKTEDGG
jgi:phosphatidylglycerol:prolipoprotein diacylglycerol transferase